MRARMQARPISRAPVRAPPPRVSTDSRRSGSGRLLVLLGSLVVLGVGRLLRHAGHGLGVLLAGLRGVLLGLVLLVLSVLAHGDLSLGIPGATPAARHPPSLSGHRPER